MLFGRSDKDVRLTEKQYNDMISKMSCSERKDFERRQRELQRDRENDRLDAWLDFEDEMDGM